jgi:drug/metabolite transporter (DMT)-like permease
MRPGLVFIGLFALLMAVYFSLQSTLGAITTIVLQAAIVLAILGSAVWLRKRFSPPER